MRQERLTPLGRQLAMLPCEPALGMALLLGGVFGCARPLAVVVAALSHRDPFVAVPGVLSGTAIWTTKPVAITTDASLCP